MKKINLNVILLIFLTVFVPVVIWKISLAIKDQEQLSQTEEFIPVLSVESGFYEEPFELSITAPEGASIYYTLDGSRPDLEALPYTEPITITYGGGRETGSTFVENMQEDWKNGDGESHPNCATVLRAIAVTENGDYSDIVTATYFIGPREYEGKMIVSIVADPEDLFGENGIYVTGKAYDDWYLGGQVGEIPMPNFLQHGDAWERPAVLEIFEEGSILQQPVGIRIQGASAREGGNKRFSVYARTKYSGSNWFDIPLFGEERNHSFVLRSGFMNGYIQHLVQDRDVASVDSRETILYLNGALWYITIAQEKYSGKYFQERYGVDDDNVIIAKGGVVDSGKAEDQMLYQGIYDFMQTHDLSDAASYEKFGQLIDIQSYIDFCCVNVYFANLDYSEYKNCICWRARKPGNGDYEDGRWRWALYDMDLENGDYGVVVEDINTFTMDTHYAGGAFNTRSMYVALKQNEDFCRQFVLSFMDMINTDFTVEEATRARESWDITMIWWGMYPDWMETYFPARTKSITGYLAEEFGLKGTCETVTLSVNDEEAGYITMNTITPDMKNGEWSGSYFTDYPVTVTAVANKGYTFVGWQCDTLSGDDEEKETVTVDIPEGGLEIQAQFRKK